MILITGASGHLGKGIITHLLKHITASEIVAFVRNADKIAEFTAQGVQVKVGHYDDVASIKNAVVGIDKLVLISGLDMHRLQQHNNVINAAKEAGVKHIVYTGVALTNPDQSAIKEFMSSHFKTEESILASGIPYTLMRNTLYSDALPLFLGAGVFENGIYLPAGNGKTPFALRSEMAEAIANVLVQSGHENKTYQITNTEAYSFQQIAEMLSQLSGKPISYTSPEYDAFVGLLKNIGVPDEAILIAAGFATDIKNNLLDISSNDLEILLGRKPTGLSIALKEMYNL